MKTQTQRLNPGKPLLLLAALGLVGTALATPAFADYSNGSRSNRMYEYNNGNANNGYRTRPRNQYAWLNRINRYGVRGKIVNRGRGYLRNCFRVKRTGRYQREAAIITVRYCMDHYGNAQIVRGTKRLVRYTGYYQPARGYKYDTPMPRY